MRYIGSELWGVKPVISAFARGSGLPIIGRRHETTARQGKEPGRRRNHEAFFDRSILSRSSLIRRVRQI